MGLRELVFDVTYTSGVDPVADVFIEHSSLVSTSVTCTMTANNVWYLERFAGPPTALEELDTVLDDLTCCGGDEIDAERRYANWSYKVLSREQGSRTVCAYGIDVDTSRSIPHLAAVYIGEGLLYETERCADRCRWRILMPQDTRVEDLYDAIRTELPAGLEVEFDHLSDPNHWGDDTVSVTDLPYEQREALEAAVVHGYYETPREITAQALAERLDLPQSTLQYRLSRAEAWLATQFVAEHTPDTACQCEASYSEVSQQTASHSGKSRTD
jgi:predicted DNA binding protein